MTLAFAPERIEHWPLARLQPYARNAKQHGPDQVAKLAASMAEFGWTVPCLVGEDGELIAGHGRVLAATQLGLTEAPVIVLGHLTEAQRRAYRIADNRLAESPWDEALLSAELNELLAEDFDLSLVGFSDGELDKLLAFVPEGDEGGEGGPGGSVPPVVIPEPPRNPASQTGDQWILGDHRLLCGDSTSETDVRRLMNGERAILFATDPPYLVDYDGSNHPTRNKDWSQSYGNTWDDSSQGSELYDGFIAAAVAEAGVRRIIYLGGLASPSGISRHLASRSATGEVLRAGKVPVVELRAGIIIGPGSAAFEVMRDLVAHLPIMVTPRWVSAKSPPIALEDLLADLEALATADGIEGAILEAAGPDRLTYEAMMRRLARALGKRDPVIIPVPVLTPELSALWLDLVTTVPAPLARALIGGMRQDLSADDTALRRAVPRTCMGVEAAIDRALALEREIGVHDRWRDGAFALRGNRSDRSFSSKRLSRSRNTSASASEVWLALASMGTRRRGDVLATPVWRLRNMIDRGLGGADAGPRAGPQPPSLGERFGTWRVVASVPDCRLTLAATRVVPGAGGIETELVPTESGTRVVATMAWHPAGTGGLIYWFATWPLRALALRALARRIARAE